MASRLRNSGNADARELAIWLHRARTRSTIAGFLVKPITSTEAALAAMRYLPTVERAQTTRAIRELRKRGLAECVTPERPHNRKYRLTQRGMRLVKASQIPIYPTVKQSTDDRRMLTSVWRRPVLMGILRYMWKHRHSSSWTAKHLRLALSREYPLSRPVFYKAVNAGVAKGLIREIGVTLIGKHRMYMLTDLGMKASEMLMK